jgi:hypothetical protein
VTTTTAGPDTGVLGPVPEDAVGALREQLRGDELGPQDRGYDGARRVWSGMIDRRPALPRCPAAPLPRQHRPPAGEQLTLLALAE